MDKIISVVSHRGYVLIFTERGKVYRMDIGDVYLKITTSLVYELALNQDLK